MDYTFLTIYIVMPAITIISSAIIGVANFFGRMKWIFCLIFGVMFMLVPYVTFTAKNMSNFGNIYWPSWEVLIAGIIISAIPMLIAAAVRQFTCTLRNGKTKDGSSSGENPEELKI